MSQPIATPATNAIDVIRKPVVVDRKLANELIDADGEIFMVNFV